MTRRIISVALIVLGALAIALAIASATVWRPTDTATLTLPQRPDAPVVISEPGVLDTVADEVTITATADEGEPVVLVLARTADVEAWVDGAPHQRITGLASWEELAVESREAASTDEATAEATATEEATATAEATEEATATAEEATLPNPAGSDLWVTELTGTGSVEMSWESTEGRWSLLAATDGTSPAPQVAMTWPVEVRTPWLVPGLVLGALLLLAGMALLAVDLLTRRELARRTAAAGRRADRDAATTSEIPAVAGGAGAAGLTRRQLREQARAQRQRENAPVGEDVREAGPAGAARGAGVVPGSARAAQLRAERTPPAGAPGDGTAVPDDHTGDTDAGHAGPGATGDQRTTGDAGVARGASVVPASDRSAELRAGRETASDDGSSTPPGDEGWTEGETAPPRDGAQTEEEPTWRSMWGFAPTDHDEEEQR